jgi:hypothetical protein
MKHPLLTLALSLSIATTACGQSMKKPDIKLNPDPQLRYEVTLTIDQDVPGPFESVIAFSYYQTDDKRVPMQPISGAVLSVDHRVPVTLRQTAPRTYQGMVYLDLLLDEDYYGLGVCRWSLMSFNAQLIAGEVRFGAAIGGKEVAAGQPRTEYYPKAAYGDTSTPNWYVPGSGAHEGVRAKRGNFFTTTLTPREALR